MKLASGKINKRVSEIVQYEKQIVFKDVLYTANSETEIEYIQLVNNTANPVTFTLYIQFLDNQVLLTRQNYVLAVEDIFTFDKKLYLKEFEQILAVIETDKAIDYFIMGTAEEIQGIETDQMEASGETGYGIDDDENYGGGI